MEGIPADSATWNSDNWTQSEELLALGVELQDAWGRLHFMAMGGKTNRLGEPIQIERPQSRDAGPETGLTTDRQAIAQWFQANR